MPGKKGKKGKGGKKSGGKGKKGKTKEYLPNLYNIPEVPDYPSQCVPIATLNLKLVNPVGFPMEFKLDMPVTTRVMIVRDEIIRKHGGAAAQVNISFHKHKPDAPAPITSSLVDMGIHEAGEVNVYYDFAPTSYPLLN